eukprot:79436-Amphidinium_carterae.1
MFRAVFGIGNKSQVCLVVFCHGNLHVYTTQNMLEQLCMSVQHLYSSIPIVKDFPFVALAWFKAYNIKILLQLQH